MNTVIWRLAIIFLAYFHIAIAHKQPVHQHITREAFKLLLKSYPQLASSEMASFIGTNETNANSAYISWGDGKVVSGAWIEDEYDIVYHYGIGKDPAFNQWLASAYAQLFPGKNRQAFTSITHFWNADGGVNSSVDLSDMADGIYWSFSNENSMQKMYKYLNGDFDNRWMHGIRIWDCSVNCEYISLASDERMANLFELYKQIKTIYCVQYQSDGEGQWYAPPCGTCPEINYPIKYVYEQLGRMSHLLQDQSVPAHVHSNSHACTHGMYCDYYEENVPYWHLWAADEVYANGGTFINPYNTWGDPLYYLMYLINQATDHYASGRSDGDNNFDASCPGLSQIVSTLGLPTSQSEVNDANCRLMHDKLFPLIIRANAGLLYWFAVETGQLPRPPLTVSISGPSTAPCATGTWTATTSGGYTPYTYAWYLMWDCEGGGGAMASTESSITPDVPCSPTWNPVGTNSPTLQLYLCGGNSYLKVDVTDAQGGFASAQYYVAGAGGGGGIAAAHGGGAEETLLKNESQNSGSIPDQFAIYQNYPNPFNPETAIAFALPEPSSVKVVISDVLGREVVRLVDREFSSGYQRVIWKGIDASGTRVGSGIYFYRIIAAGQSGKQFTKVMKMLVTK